MPPHLPGGSGGHKVQPRTLFGAFGFFSFLFESKTILCCRCLVRLATLILQFKLDGILCKIFQVVTSQWCRMLPGAWPETGSWSPQLLDAGDSSKVGVNAELGTRAEQWLRDAAVKLVQ